MSPLIITSLKIVTGLMIDVDEHLNGDAASAHLALVK